MKNLILKLLGIKEVVEIIEEQKSLRSFGSYIDNLKKLAWMRVYLKELETML